MGSYLIYRMLSVLNSFRTRAATYSLTCCRSAECHSGPPRIVSCCLTNAVALRVYPCCTARPRPSSATCMCGFAVLGLAHGDRAARIGIRKHRRGPSGIFPNANTRQRWAAGGFTSLVHVAFLLVVSTGVVLVRIRGLAQKRLHDFSRVSSFAVFCCLH